MSSIIRHQNQISSLISSIYDASMEQSVWDSIQPRFTRLIGNTGGHILLLNNQNTPIDGVIYSSGGSELALQAQQEYFDYYHQFDDQRILNLLSNNQNKAINNDDITPRESLKSCPVVNEYHKKFNCAQQLVYGSKISRDMLMCITSVRRKAIGFNDREMQTFGLVSGHIAKSLKIRERLTALHGMNSELVSVVSNQKNSVLVVDKYHNVLWMNEVAQTLLQQGSSLGTLRGRLHIANSLQRKQLDKLIQQATFLSSCEKKRCGFTFVFQGNSKLVVTVFSSVLETAFLTDRKGVAILVIQNPEQKIEVPQNLVQRYFSLTPAEAKLAVGIANGLSIKEYAEQYNIAESTARSTLKAVMSKTQSNRQVELTRKILTLLF